MAVSFLSLPNELKYHILDYINTDARNNPTTHNTRHALRQVHPWFRAQISKLDLREGVLAAEAAENIPWDDLVCYTCFRILPGSMFEAFSGPSCGPSCYLRRRKQTCSGCRSWLSMKESSGNDRVIRKLLLGFGEKKPS